jgi:hypothetical protein
MIGSRTSLEDPPALKQLVQQKMELELAFVSMTNAIRGEKPLSNWLPKLSKAVPENRKVLITVRNPEPTDIDAPDHLAIHNKKVVE